MSWELLENSIWKDADEKDKFLSKNKRLTNEFWINFLGVLALYQKYRDDAKLMLYIKQSPVRLERVVDDNSDLMVVLKEVSKANLINENVMMKITRLLAKIKTGQINSIDENLLREEIVRKIKVSQVYPYPEVAKLIKEFIKGSKTLVEMLPDLYQLAFMKKRALEFRTLYRRLSHTNVDPTTPSVATSSTPQPTASPVSPVASALTGAPKTSTNDNTTPNPVQPITPKPVSIKQKTLDDIKPMFDKSVLISNDTALLGFFLYLNEKYPDDQLSMCSSWKIRVKVCQHWICWKFYGLFKSFFWTWKIISQFY